jgi:hypothetical protein
MLTDSSGNSNDGTINGATWTTGKYSGGLSFDGIDDLVSIPNSASLDITGNQITLTAWFNPVDGGISGGSRVISKKNDGGGSDVYALYTTNNRVWFRLDGTELVSTNTFSNNNWVNIAVVYDGALKRIYINGVQESTTQSKTDNIDSSTRGVFMGHREAEDRWFNGIIDNVRIYDTALTAQEIINDMNTPVTSQTQQPTSYFGDLNNDLKVDVSDIFIILRHILGIQQDQVSDVNEDGNVNIFDLVITAKYFGKQYGTDTTPPSILSGIPSQNILPLGTTTAIVGVETDERATCRYNPTPTDFASMTAFDRTGGIQHTKEETGLSDNSNYLYYVQCRDEAGNLNSTNYLVNFSIGSYVNGGGPCTPDLNACSGLSCGSATNGTCGSVSCGTCGSGFYCSSGQCVASPSGGTADPTLLPLATGQMEEDYYSAFDALGVPSMVQGDSYRSPESSPGVLVYKVTDPNTPRAGSANHWAPQGGGGGPFISMPWIGPGGDTYYTLMVSSANQGYLIDMNYNNAVAESGTVFSNNRAMPSGVGNLDAIFSYNPSTPRIMYHTTGGGQIRRYNTETMVYDEPVNLNFPSPSSVGTSWLNMDVNDEWFVAHTKSIARTKAWNAVTDQVVDWGTTGSDEAHISRDGKYVLLVGGTFDTDLGTIATGPPPTDLAPEIPGYAFSHPDGGPNGYFVVTAPADGTSERPAPAYYDPVNDIYSTIGPAYGGSGHNSGTWQINNEPGLNAWTLVSQYSGDSLGGTIVPSVIRKAGVFWRLDGSEARLVALNFNRVLVKNQGEPHHTASPDGKLVMWNSDARSIPGGIDRNDVYVAIIPTS